MAYALAVSWIGWVTVALLVYGALVTKATPPNSQFWLGFKLWLGVAAAVIAATEPVLRAWPHIQRIK